MTKYKISHRYFLANEIKGFDSICVEYLKPFKKAGVIRLGSEAEALVIDTQLRAQKILRMIKKQASGAWNLVEIINMFE